MVNRTSSGREPMAAPAASSDGSLSLHLRPTTGAIRAARHQVVRWARAAGMASTHEHTLALLTSEVVANAVRHASGDVTVTARAGEVVLTVEVTDGSRRRPSVLRQPPTALGGRGMDIVDRMAQSWGVRPHGDGKTVWFAVPL